MPIDSGSAYEVSGVTVDVSGKTAEDARLGGWRIAQRKGWAMLAQRLGRSGVGASDGMLDSLVSGIVVENEQIGPTRYVARLGVLFDRTRAASVLGVSAYADRSPPMLVMPLQVSGGVSQMFETRTPRQQAGPGSAPVTAPSIMFGPRAPAPIRCCSMPGRSGGGRAVGGVRSSINMARRIS